MNTVVLLMLVWKAGELVQVIEPLPGTRFQTVEVCERVLAELLQRQPPPEGYDVTPICVGPPQSPVN